MTTLANKNELKDKNSERKSDSNAKNNNWKLRKEIEIKKEFGFIIISLLICLDDE